MTRCETCKNQRADSIMYIKEDGAAVCIHCLHADEKVEKMKTPDQRNAELVDAIKRTITNLKSAQESNPRRIPGKSPGSKGNLKRHLELIDQYLYIAVSELTRAIS